MTEDKQKERLEKAEQKAKLCTFLFMGFIAFCLLLAAYSHTEDMEKAQKITGTVSNKYIWCYLIVFYKKINILYK